jgi:hypothetical protein
MTTYTFAGPSESAAFALQAAKERREHATAPVTSPDVKWVMVPDGKGGFKPKAEPVDTTTTSSIALFKSKTDSNSTSCNSKTCNSGSCAVKH